MLQKAILADILSPYLGSEPPKQPPSPAVPFGIGQKVVVQKVGWAGWDFVTAIRGEFVRLGDSDRPVWFHYKELRDHS